MTASKPERLGEIDQAAASEFEGEIREFVRRDVSFWRRQQRQEPATDAVAESVNSVLQRVSSASIEEIERVIGELQTMRDMLRAEGERVQREIAGYANLSQAAMASMKIMSESLSRWKPAPAIRHEPEPLRAEAPSAPQEAHAEAQSETG
jgi:hypothetical protein